MRTAARWAVVVLALLHGLVHLLGTAKGLGWAPVPELHEPTTIAGALLWLVPAVLVVTAAVMLAVRTRGWWVAMGLAALVSQAVIVTAWTDAKAGTVANIVLAVAAAYGYASQGPRSPRADYRRRAEAALARPTTSHLVNAADLAGLPAPLAGYLRRCGAVGQPRVASFHARIHGRIRSDAASLWMPFTGEQVNTYGQSPRRLFLLDATMHGLPVDVLHVFEDHATMRVKLCSVVPIVDAAGPDMDRAETVTLFNDLCVLAPAALVDAPVTWAGIDDHRVRGTFTHGAQTVSAELVFSDDNELVDFVSHDRLRASADGKSFTPQTWSTPIRAYRDIGPRRVVVSGEGRWHAPAPEGAFSYLEFELDDITYHPSRPGDN
ncbi:MAG: DUF6544 family protein [Dermatophilaceae bacterium]